MDCKPEQGLIKMRSRSSRLIHSTNIFEETGQLKTVISAGKEMQRVTGVIVGKGQLFQIVIWERFFE
jgi:hypothetical protein